MMDHQSAFQTELREGGDRPERLALMIGTLIDPALDVDAYTRRLDELADQVHQQLPGGAVGRAMAEGLVAILHQQMGYCGNTHNYYDPGNSYLHKVLDSGRGLPITLSLLYVAVGRRLGIQLHGMGFPGHFMVEYRDGTGSWILDPFHGNVLPPEDLSRYLSQVFDQPIRLSVSLDQYRVSTNQLILRILNNLRAVYVANNRLLESRPVLDLMLILEPTDPGLWRDRGLINFRLDRLLDAESDLRRYFLHNKKLSLYLAEPEYAFTSVAIAGSLPEPAQEPTSEERSVLFVLEQIRSSIRRLN